MPPESDSSPVPSLDEVREHLISVHLFTRSAWQRMSDEHLHQVHLGVHRAPDGRSTDGHRHEG